MPTRREFSLAVAAALGACATGKPAAPTVKPPPPAPPPAPRPEPTAASQPTASPVAEAMLGLLSVLHGEKLSAADLEKLKKPITSMADKAAKLRAYRFANADEPHGGLIGNPGAVP